ncbi:histone deacetylase complex subunit SAP130 isoform X2 [Phlebotomus papatasi]|uniref:histone deacetylase complex subunit SAP130 isoform X2 n=1 Tax=Phlebotomus papatasi TaxID=29031 RepID=UPI0024847294|nr:histone deacetylase complex subunit SAP130 isoform X2 [Phlebotomus papatasi]
MSGQEGDKIPVGKTIAFPIDLAPKVALVKPATDGKPQTQQTFRTIGQPPMRLIAGAVQTSGTAQIIQTHLMPQAMIKQVDTSGRTQITALPARSLSQTSITVTRTQTPTTYVPRGVTTVTNMAVTRAVAPNPRTPTPPAANISSTFVRSSAPPRTPSPAATVISPVQGATTWMSGTGAVQVQVPAQLIRASISQPPRPPRMLTPGSVPSSVSTTATNTLTANVVAASPNASGQSVSASQTVNVSGASQQQIFATLAAVQCAPRQQTATLVYSNVSNPQQQFPGQRLAVATSLGGPRQVRPIQLNTARLSAAGIGVRVSAANISIRAPSVPVLAPSSVLTTIPTAVQARTSQAAAGAGLTATGTLPATRIIQVQQPPTGGTAQVINASRLTGNLMTLHPVIMNTPTGTQRGTAATSLGTGKVQPSLTITQLGKLPPQSGTQGTQAPALAQVSGTQSGHHTVSGGMALTSQTNQGNQSIAQIVSVNQQGAITGQAHQLVAVNQQQILTATQNPNSGGPTVVPLAIATRPGSNVLAAGGQQGQGPTVQQVVSSQAGGLVRTSVPGIGVSSAASVSGTPVNQLVTVPPIAKVLPQQQQQQQQVSSAEVPSVFIQRPASSAGVTPSATVPGTVTGVQLALTSSSSGTVTSLSYSAAGGSFAVVGGNRQIHGLVPSTSGAGGQVTSVQTVPVRFQPQLIVDSSTPGQPQHQIITMTQPPSSMQQQHMIIPVPAKLAPSTSPRPSILRKRDNEGVCLQPKGVKNLVPILQSMGGNKSVTAAVAGEPEKEKEVKMLEQPASPRPPSTDGSTTVSATSSPGLEQQQQQQMPDPEEISMALRVQSELAYTTMSAAFASVDSRSVNQQNNTNEAAAEASPRKKPRKQQLEATTSQPAEQTKPPQAPPQTQVNNKENNNQAEVTIKKPRTCSLLETYKQNWKAANNHFQRYSDVKPREERRPSVMDLANQAHVLQKVNGWKIYHLSAQMEDLCELESQVYDKLSSMLQVMEAHEQSPDVDRVNDLLKGNMQRSKVIIDGVNEARGQIMKIFDHKSHVSDIIHRCASKRNFKKREKT